jgi:hypothetical protein
MDLLFSTDRIKRRIGDAEPAVREHRAEAHRHCERGDAIHIAAIDNVRQMLRKSRAKN